MQQQQPQQWGRVKLTEVNPHLVCVLCHGYFIDATTMAECPHSFCRSCIILYLESKSYCPICEVQIHKTKPHLNLKPDKTLQDIVYKLVPGLFHSEMRRRREFYQKHPNRDMYLSPEARGVGIERIIYSPEDSISLSLEYYDQEREREEWAAARPGEQKPETAKPEKPGGENSSSSSSTTSSSTSTTSSATAKRYLQCPAVVTMRHLKKFIRMKYNLSQSCTVELLYRRESLPDSYSLMDIAYIYTWKRNGPMRFYYRIHVPMTVTRVLPPVEPTVRITELAVDGVNKEEKQQRKPGTKTESSSSSSSVESRALLDAVGLKPRGGDKEDDISLVVTTTVVPEEKKVDVTAGEEKVCQNNATTTTAKNETHEAANDVGGSSVLPGVKRPYEHDPLSVSLLLSLRNGHPKPVVTTAMSTPIITTSTTTTMTATASTPVVSSSVTNTAVVSTTTNTVAPTQDRSASAPSSVDTVVTSSATVNCSKPHINGTAAPAVSESNTQQQPVINKQLSNYAVNDNSQRPAPSQITFNGNRSSGGNTMAGKTPALDKIPLSRMIQQRNVSSNGGIRNNGQLMNQIKREHQQTNGVQVTNGNSCPTSSSSGVFVTQENARSKYTTSSSSSSQNKPLTVAEKVLKSAKYMPSANTTAGIVRTQTKDANSNNNLLNQNNAQNNSNNSISSTTGNKDDKPVAHSTKAVNSDNGDKTELTTKRAVDQSSPQHRKEVNRLEQILKESLKRKCLSSCDKNNGGNSELKNSALLIDKEQQQTKKKDGADNSNNNNENTSQKTTTVQVENAKREEEIQRTTEGATLSGVDIKEADARAESPSAASIQDHVASASRTTAVDTSLASTTSILKRKLNDPAYSHGLVSFNSSVSSHDQDNKKRRLVTPEVSIELTSKPNVSISSSAASTVTTASNSNNINKTNNSEVTDFSKLTKKFLESLQQMKKPNAMTTTNEFKFKDVDQLCASTVKIEKVPSVMMSPETVTHVNGDNGLVRPTTSVPEEAHKRKADTVEVTIHRVSDDRPSTSETQSLPLHPSPKKMPRLIEINAPPRPKLSAPLHHQDRKQQKTGLKMTTVRKEVPIGKEIPTLVRKDVNGALDLSSGSSTTTTTTTNKIKTGFQRPQTSSSKSPTMSTSSLAPLLAMTSFPMPEMKTTTSPPIRVPTLKQKTPLHLQPRPSSLSSSSPSPPAESRPSTADMFSAAAFQQFYRHQLEMHNRLLASQVSNNNNNSWRQDPVTAKKLEDWMRTVMTCGGLSPHPLMFPAQLSPESHRK